ncbi:hypothetical protein [Rhodococcus sp. Q]|uniref:hypothetical protein n=1 Tax=Rhodococcus sp. Q TaxID=2502252 RepID=UPI0010F8D0DE|nr:hypothetical protein [Rhodococcus sp. Q]
MPDLDVEQVLRRWQLPGSGAPTVAVVGPPGSGRSTLADALASLLPAFRVRDGSDPAASVVVVAFDASAPIGREELGLLTAAAATGSVAIAVVTRIDAHHDWKSVLDRDEAVLAGHARRVVAGPILPVSVSTGLGLPELRTAVERALDDGGATPRHVELDRVRAMVRATADDLRRDDATAALRERRAALIADRDGPRTESAAALRRLSALARVDLTHLVGDRVRAATAALRAEVDRSGRSMAGEFPRRVREEVDVLTTAVDATTDAVLGDLAAAVMGAPHPVAGPNRRPPVVDDPEPRHRGVEDRMMIVVGASAGAGLGRLVVSPMSHIAAFDLVALPVTLLIGGVAAWALTRMRGLAADRAHLRQWLAEAMTQVRSGLEQRALTRLVESEAEIVDAVQRAHRERARTTERSLAELDRELRDGVARTSGRLAAVERDLAVLDRALVEHDRPFEEPADRVLRPSPQ